MFGLFRSSHPQPKKSASRHYRPRLEQLEDRFCPAAAMVSSLTAVSDGSWVTVSGNVSDESPETAQVFLSGALNATVTPDSSGYFAYTDYFIGSGSVSVTALDDESLYSDPVNAYFETPDQPPTLDLSFEYLSEQQIRVFGQATDDSPGAMMISMYGAVNGYIYTEIDGSFDCVMTAEGLGTFSAVTSDIMGNGSNLVSHTLTSATPTLSVNWEEESQGLFRFWGNVDDESAAGLTVSFGGSPSGAQGQSTIVQADGSFQMYLQLSAIEADSATITTTVTDWWGQESVVYTTYLDDDLAPTVSITNVEYLEQRQIRVTGVVADEDPAGLLVTFTGAASGTVYTESNGMFKVTLTATQLGELMATTTDLAEQASAAANVTLTSNAPTITGFTCFEDVGGWYELRGQVDDEDVVGLKVYFGGAPVSLAGQWQNILADGSFCLRLQLNGTITDEGTATALVTDWWGLESNLATCLVDQTNVG